MLLRRDPEDADDVGGAAAEVEEGQVRDGPLIGEAEVAHGQVLGDEEVPLEATAVDHRRRRQLGAVAFR